MGGDWSVRNPCGFLAAYYPLISIETGPELAFDRGVTEDLCSWTKLVGAMVWLCYGPTANERGVSILTVWIDDVSFQ